MAGLTKGSQQTMDKDTLIDFRDVTFGFSAETTLFSGISLSIKKGAFYVIKGPSGVGKTTFLRLFNRFEEPLAGEIRFKGKLLNQYSPPDLRRSMLYIQQTPTMMDGSVLENLLLPFSFKHNLHLQRPHRGKLKSLLEAVHLQEMGLNGHAMTLSVGQMQRLSLIRGLLLGPEVLLLDEPTSALDRESALAVTGLLERLNAESGLTVLAVTHKTVGRGNVAHRCLEVNDGNVRETE